MAKSLFCSSGTESFVPCPPGGSFLVILVEDRRSFFPHPSSPGGPHWSPDERSDYLFKDLFVFARPPCCIMAAVPALPAGAGAPLPVADAPAADAVQLPVESVAGQQICINRIVNLIRKLRGISQGVFDDLKAVMDITGYRHQDVRNNAGLGDGIAAEVIVRAITRKVASSNGLFHPTRASMHQWRVNALSNATFYLWMTQNEDDHPGECLLDVFGIDSTNLSEHNVGSVFESMMR